MIGICDDRGAMVPGTCASLSRECALELAVVVEFEAAVPARQSAVG
jgi:hypothetical protein